jgi:hypothetical protein
MNRSHNGQGGGENASLGLERHSLRVDPSRSMKAITDEVGALLDGLEEASLRSGALLASELIAQVVGRDPGFRGGPVGLEIQVREGVVRMEATGPAAPSIRADHDSASDPLADWGSFILDRLADRWGVDGPAQRAIWAEIERPAAAFD